MAEEMQNEKELDLTQDVSEVENTEAVVAETSDAEGSSVEASGEAPAHANAHWLRLTLRRLLRTVTLRIRFLR